LGKNSDDSQDARALLNCLSYLEEEANRMGLQELAHLIGVAALEAEETVDRLETLPRRNKPRIAIVS